MALNMKNRTHFILALALLCVVYANSGQAIAEDGQQDEPQTTTVNQDPPTTTTIPTTLAPKPTKKTKNIKASDDNPKKVKGACPEGCNCKDKPKRLTCSARQNFPDLTEWSGLIFLDMSNSSLENADLQQLLTVRDSLETLNLSRCNIKTFSAPATGKKEQSFTKLKTLIVSENSLQSIGKLASWKFSALETLDLASNPLVDLNQNDFNNTKSLQNLNLQYLQLKSIHEQSFLPLGQLKTLNMSGTSLENHLGDKQFVGNQKLETVDLTDNGLIEVPFALRSTNSITRLVLNSNNMTSLRQSDFINRTKLIELEIRACPRLSKIDDLTFSDLTSLKRLILSDNLALNSIPKDAFKSSSANNITLDLIDIRNNNLTSLTNPLEFSSLAFKQLLLSGNPWHCDCNLRWFYELPSQARPLAHCRTPAQFQDIEVGESLSIIDCETVDSILRIVIVTGFILFLIILAALVVVQKSDICRRFLWRDQYGTIYYTKASFPPETA